MIKTAAKGGALGVLLAVLGLPAGAGEGWEGLSGAQIAAALNERSLQYATATQIFYKSGKTLYTAGRPSWGNWRVQGDQYCSQWPPSALWTCYGLERHVNGSGVTTGLRFVSETGHMTEGTYLE